MGGLWMTVTHDKYEFPVVIADTGRELAEKVGVRENSIYTLMNKSVKRGHFCRYKHVIWEDEDEDID